MLEVITYRALHNRLRRERGRARDQACARCGAQAGEWSLKSTATETHVENVQGFDLRYSMSLDEYEPLCVACHRATDQRTVCANGLHPWPESAVSNGQWPTCGPCRKITNRRGHEARKARQKVPC